MPGRQPRQAPAGEREELRDLVQRAGGNVSQAYRLWAASHCGKRAPISRQAFVHRLESHDLLSLARTLGRSNNVNCVRREPSADEAQRIRNALATAKGDRGQAAAALGVSRHTLWRRMKQYRISA